MPKVSIIIRTKNEERWISSCLKSVFLQVYKNFEVIIVDNNSTDKTLEKAKNFNVKLFGIDDFLPGKALNLGIHKSKGDIIVSLSAHCIPTNNKWLSNLIRNFDSDEIAGIYGRQEPMSYSSDIDKRDLMIAFGLDKKIQVKDSFFHNANSAIRRDVWEKIPFDETVTNLEDRVWAQEVLKRGYRIIYEPEACVYHYHGIHQELDPERARNVVKILESLEAYKKGKKKNSLNIDNLNIIALIPVTGEVEYLGNRPLIEYTIEKALDSKYIDEVIVSTDNPELAKIAEKAGAKAPFLRPPELSFEYVSIDEVFQYSLAQLEKNGVLPDLLVLIEVTYPFRPKGFLDKLVTQLVENGFDSVLPVYPEYKSSWIKEDGKIKRIDKGFMPRQYKKPIYIGLSGLGCITHPIFVREKRRIGDKVGLVEIRDPLCALQVRDKMGFELANKLIDGWWEKNK